MKQYNDDFLQLLEDCAPTPALLSDQETKRLWNMVAARGGLKIRQSRGGMRTLLVAAAMGTALFAAAASYTTVSDAFRSILKEQDAAGGPITLSAMEPVVDKSGSLIGKTVPGQSLDVTVRGVIGDANGFQIPVDIEDSSGEPLAVRQMEHCPRI